MCVFNKLHYSQHEHKIQVTHWCVGTFQQEEQIQPKSNLLDFHWGERHALLLCSPHNTGLLLPILHELDQCSIYVFQKQ
jgi:hypothetical protein